MHFPKNKISKNLSNLILVQHLFKLIFYYLKFLMILFRGDKTTPKTYTKICNYLNTITRVNKMLHSTNNCRKKIKLK